MIKKIIFMTLAILAFNIGNSKTQTTSKLNKNKIVYLEKKIKWKSEIIRTAPCDNFAMYAMLAMEDIAGCSSSEDYNSGYNFWFNICGML